MKAVPTKSILDIEKKYKELSPILNERGKRIWAATEAASYGKGGVTAVHRATGLSRNTIYSGLKEIKRTTI